MTKVQPAQSYPQPKLEVREANVHRRRQRPLGSHFEREELPRWPSTAQPPRATHVCPPSPRALQLQL